MNSIVSFLRALWQRRIAVTLAVVLLLIVVMIAATIYTLNIPQLAANHQQTVVLGPTQFAPENPSALRVVVRNSETNAPITDANVAVKLAPKGIGFAQTLYSGKTDKSGTAPVAFTIPANVSGDQTLVIETDSGAGRDHIERAIKVQRDYKVLVTTDKPLYQPSQVIHLRALALGALDRLPAQDQALEFLVEDPKGNKLYRKTIQTSAYGIASADFTLAETVTSGDYKITASVGDTKSEKTVTVKPYVLPKFKLTAETERGYYLPGEKVNGTIHADYFFGKPVAKSDVSIKGVVYDVARAETVSITGKTDDQGAYAFSFTLPNYFAASGLNKSTADFGLEVSVTDQADHIEQTSLSLPISKDAILIDAVPESGKLVAGVENIVYVMTSLPDGSPLAADLTISNLGITTNTGKYGLAEVRFTPQRGNTSLNITARDTQGRSTARTITLTSDTATTQVLLRPDHATYRVGETMHLDVLTGGSVGSIYLDIIKEKQTMSTRAADVVNGRATIDVDVTPELIGTLQLHAYQVERDSTITRDTRIVVVEQPSELNVAIQADRDVYRPGDDSKVTFSVTDSQGKGVQSALGVTGVDEAVFALAEQDPGFAKLYFLLQQELLDPKFQVKGFSLPEVVAPQPTTIPADVRAAQDQSARAAWSNATPIDFVLRVNSQPEKIDAANKAQAAGFNNLAAWLALFMSILPLALIGLILASLYARKILGKSLGAWMAGLLVYCVTSPFLVGGIAIVGGFLVQMKYGVILVATVFLAWIIAFGILVGYAIVKRDKWLQAGLMLFAAYFIFLGMFAYIAQRATTISDTTAFAIIISWLVGLAAVTLMGMGYLAQKETTPGVAAIALVLLFIPATILLALMPTAGPFLRVMGSPGLYVPPAYLTGCAAAPTPFPGQSDSNAFRNLEKSLGGAQGAPQPMVGAAAPTAAPAATALAGGQAPQTTEQPRLRQYFPETLYFNPQAITNENGTVTLDIPLADSITTWRLAATASSQKGELGNATAGIRVFQDFFVDLDLPVALTQNDEISIPVAVYNYLPQAQKVKLQIDQQPWFTLQDDAEKTLTIASNDIEVVYFRIKATSFGMQKLKVTALGEKMSDAIQREIRVYPDGKSIEATQSNWLKDGTTQTIDIPTPAIPGATRLEVKIYPGVMSQVVDGLDGILQMPFG